MDASKVQQDLFKVIKASIPKHLPVADEIAKVLNVSVDSVYRRMRNEKTISLEELYVLCSHYKISIDSIFNIQTGSFSFQGSFSDRNEFRFKEFLDGLIRWLTYFNGFKEKIFYSTPRDIPPLYHYQFREFGAFKYYLWMRNLYGYPEFINRKFNFDDYPEEVFATGQKALTFYNQLSLIEFWGSDTINGTIRQIEYYRDMGMFQSDEDVFKIYSAFENLMKHLEQQAALGYTFDFNDPKKTPMGEYQVFYSELFRGDNNALVILDGVKVSLIVPFASNYMVTRDLTFTEKMHNYLSGVMKSSTRISSVSEWERSKFFHTLQERIARRKNAL